MTMGYRNLYTPTGGYEEEKLVNKTIDAIINVGDNLQKVAGINMNFLYRRMRDGLVDIDCMDRCKRTIRHLDALAHGAKTAPF